MAQLKLTRAQYEWLSQNARKIKRNKEIVVQDPKSSITGNEVDRMAKLFDGNIEILEFSVSRKDLRTIQNILEHATAAIVNQVIPGYDQRMSNQPELKEKYKPYREAAVDTLNELDNLLEDVKGML